MAVLSEILREKAHQGVHAVSPDDTMRTALESMARYDIGGLMVMQGKAIVGIVTERDYARKIALLGRSSADTLVRDVMTQRVIYVDPARSVEECLGIMTRNHMRHLPVVDAQGELVGLVSIGDLVKQVISQQQFMISQLEQYIGGSHLPAQTP